MAATQRGSNREFFSYGTEQAPNSSIAEGLNPEVQLIGGVYRTTAPTYTDGQNALLSFTSGGALRIESAGAGAVLTTLPNKLETEVITWSAATTGAVATHPLVTVTGVVAMTVFAKVITDATSAGAATLEVGTALNTAALLPQVAFSVLDAGEIWHDVTPDASVELDTVLTKKIVTQSVGVKIAGATVTGGTIQFFISWYPISSDGNVTIVSPFV